MNSEIASFPAYCKDLNNYKRRKSIEVDIGGVPCGGDNPIRVQSMTTVDTMDTLGSVEQVLKMVAAGCEYVRITAPSIKEAENLGAIKNELRKRGCTVPLVADIHFTPNAAEVAAKIVEKVRVNPGNYADKKKFESIEYTDASYQAELDRIKEKFEPLVQICKEHGTAMRIGTNHGSLSDRIMSRYGDTAIGMVESALEFLRICEAMDYHQVVLSMKSSNTRVMVQAYRLLVQKMDEEGMQPYPLHLGVTEAGEGEDGRIKSAVGIGTLLEDGLGDTIRVSLTEEPELEAPVAFNLVNRYNNRNTHNAPLLNALKDPYSFEKRESLELNTIGGHNVPVVVANMSQENAITLEGIKNVGHYYLPATDKWTTNDLAADFIYSGNKSIDFDVPPNGMKFIVDWTTYTTTKEKANIFPLIQGSQLSSTSIEQEDLVFVDWNLEAGLELDLLQGLSNAVLLVGTSNHHAMATIRQFFYRLMAAKIKIPVVLTSKYEALSEEQMQLYAATDIGGLLIDGLGDGVLLHCNVQSLSDTKFSNNLSFGILQAARTRMSKTEYISCPSCGRTLFDLQETTAMIRKRTDHLKGVKIGIMGCIVNGPGEMADADYGYVGSGKGKITLYKGQDVVKKNVQSDLAVEELINIIKEDDNWVEPVQNDTLIEN